MEQHGSALGWGCTSDDPSCIRGRVCEVYRPYTCEVYRPANPRTNPCVCVPTFTNSTQRKNLQYFNHRQHDQKTVHKNV
jgi:hypothetical protein